MKKYALIFLIILSGAGLYGAVTAPDTVYPEFDGASMTLSWSVTDTAGINNFAIYRSTEASLSDAQWDNFSVTTLPPSARSYTDALTNTTLAYSYRVRPYTASAADGSYSAVVHAAPYPGGTNTALCFDSKVVLKWNDSPTIGVTAYNIYRSTQPEITASSFIGTATGAGFTDNTSANLIQYFYRVQPVSTVNGSLSVPVTAVAFALPRAPSGASSVIGGTTANITWSGSNIRTSYDISGYNIYRSVSSVSDSDLVAFSNTASFTDPGLSPSTMYQYRLRAVDTMANLSPPYDFSLFCPGIPSTPSGLTVTANSISALITWNYNNSREGVYKYLIFRDSVKIAESGAANYTDTSVVPGSTYVYGVEAQNSYGISAMASASPVAVIPSAPQGLSLVRGTIPGDLVLSWQLSPFFENVTGYNVYRAKGSPVFTSPEITDAPPFVDTGLNTGETYYYRVSAFNAIEGAYSQVLSAMPVTLPANVENLHATGYNDYAFLEWDSLPAGYDITGYNIYKSTSPEAETYSLAATAPAGASGYLITGLNISPNYYLKVAGLNSYGAGDTINASYTYITLNASAAPRSPDKPVVSSPGDGTIALNWTGAPTGSGVTSYNIYRSQISGSYGAPVAVVTSPSYKETAGTLVADTMYYYVITSEAGGLESTVSAEGNTKPFYRPYAALNKSGSYISGSSVLVWDKPAGLGTYQSADNYRIYRSTNAAFGFDIIQNSLDHEYFVDSSINTSFTHYFYMIKNYDTLNYEDQSTDVVNVSIVNIPFQAPPSSLVAIAGDSRVSLIWRVTTPEYYNIYRREATNPSYGAPIAYGISFASKEYVDTGLTNGKTYVYMIKAVNAAGEGPASMEVSALPYVAVSLPSDASISAQITNKKDVLLSWNAALGSTPPCTLSGYYVLRSTDGGGSYTQLTQTTLTSYLDTATEWNKIYYYIVKTIDTCGNVDAIYTPANITLPKPVNRIRVYKNLFNLSLNVPLRLRYVLVSGGKIKLSVYTLSGAFVREIVNTDITGPVSDENPYESQDFYWDGKNQSGEKVASGVYVLSLETKSARIIEKVAVIK